MTRHDDDDAFDAFGILRDGKSTRVSVMMRDAAMSPLQRSVMADGLRRDAARRLGLADAAALHKPGQRFCTDEAARARVEEVYQDEKRKLQDAWRKPVADAAGEFLGARPGDKCTLDGQPGHLDHRLRCVPDDKQDSVPRRMKPEDAQAIRDAAYEESVLRDENAWRGPAR